ncbi:hypothetical protein HZA56_19035 [Candidatus Poribacteria bacterium]|nr:hypothetical protein [Candidatus Poribacteria bacterium]
MFGGKELNDQLARECLAFCGADGSRFSLSRPIKDEAGLTAVFLSADGDRIKIVSRDDNIVVLHHFQNLPPDTEMRKMFEWEHDTLVEKLDLAEKMNKKLECHDNALDWYAILIDSFSSYLDEIANYSEIVGETHGLVEFLHQRISEFSGKLASLRLRMTEDLHDETPYDLTTEDVDECPENFRPLIAKAYQDNPAVLRGKELVATCTSRMNELSGLLDGLFRVIESLTAVHTEDQNLKLQRFTALLGVVVGFTALTALNQYLSSENLGFKVQLSMGVIITLAFIPIALAGLGYWWMSTRVETRGKCLRYREVREHLMSLFTLNANNVGEILFNRSTGSAEDSTWHEIYGFDANKFDDKIREIEAAEQAARKAFLEAFGKLSKAWREREREYSIPAVLEKIPKKPKKPLELFRSFVDFVELNETTNMLFLDCAPDKFPFPDIYVAIALCGISLEMDAAPFAPNEIELYLQERVEELLGDIDYEIDEGKYGRQKKKDLWDALKTVCRTVPALKRIEVKNIKAAMNDEDVEETELEGKLVEELYAGNIRPETVLEGLGELRLSTMMREVKQLLAKPTGNPETRLAE